MARSFSLALMFAATAALGCGGRETGVGPSTGTTASGGSAGTTMIGRAVGRTGSGGAVGRTGSGGAVGRTGSGGAVGRTGSGGAAGATVSGGAAGKVAPVSCTSSSEDAGATSSGDANAPVFHRATPACCPAERGPVVGGDDYTTACSSDSECTDGANGRCFPFEGLVMDPGCSYDECFTDSHCPSLSPCLCRGSAADSTANVCLMGGNCAVDADCGPGGYCSPSPSPPAGHDPGCGYANYAYYCHTKNDSCINASDCPAAKSPDPQDMPDDEYFPICAYDQKLQRWGCDQSVCLLP